MTFNAALRTKDELLLALQRGQHDVTGLFSAMPGDVFFSGSPVAWSPAQNLEHLIKSVRPVAQALRLPKWLLRLLFGSAAGPSRSYAAVRDDYLTRLTAGAVASGRYLPSVANATANSSATQEQLLLQWERVSNALTAGMAGWSDYDLDKHRLPHPILGKLTVREMLFFTLYHSLHHATGSPE